MKICENFKERTDKDMHIVYIQNEVLLKWAPTVAWTHRRKESMSF